MLEHVTVTRYVTPLREGGSLPAIVEADNLGTYVQPGPVHSGLTTDPAAELTHLFNTLVRVGG